MRCVGPGCARAHSLPSSLTCQSPLQSSRMSKSLMSMASESSVANDENDDERVRPMGGQSSRPGVKWAE